MISVAFEKKNGKSYYKQHRTKYHLKNEDALLDSIPSDTSDRMRFYYYEDGWVFDEEAYAEYLKEIEKAQQEAEANDTSITQEEMLKAMMELAQNQSDLEDALVEVAELVGGE